MDSSQHRRLALAPALLALVLLAGLAAQHPGLQQVDFLSFSGRARRLSEGQDWLNPLYPVGYPLLLWMGRLPGLDLLGAAKLISVLAGSWAVFSLSRRLHPVAGLWLLGHGAFLQWGSTEGTDVLAACLCLGAVLTAEQGRARVSGGLLGLACMIRYTGVGVLPVVLLLLWAQAQPMERTSQLRRAMGWALICTIPHWLAALVLLRSPFPDQSFNLAIGAGAPTELFSVATLERWPRGSWMALQISLNDWSARIGAVGVVLGLIRRDRRAAALLGMAAAHVALTGIAFGNERLLLPASMAWSLGVFGLLPSHSQSRGRSAVVAALTLIAMIATWNHFSNLRQPTTGELQRAAAHEVVQALPGPVLSSTPWIYQIRNGWLEQSLPVRAAAMDPEIGRALGDHAIGPDQVLQFCRDRGITTLALDIGRVGTSYPALRPLLRSELPDGFYPASELPGWVFLRVE